MPSEKPSRIFVPGTSTLDVPFSVTRTDTNWRPSRLSLAGVLGLGESVGAGEVLAGAVADCVGDGLALWLGSALPEGCAPIIEHADRDKPTTAMVRAKRLFTAVRRAAALISSRGPQSAAERPDPVPHMALRRAQHQF